MPLAFLPITLIYIPCFARDHFTIQILSQPQVTGKRPETPEYFRGKEGTKKNVASNYLQLECEAKKGIFHYEVDFEPQIDNRQECFRLLKALEEITGPVKVCFFCKID